jgi:hypothetical protein
MQKKTSLLGSAAFGVLIVVGLSAAAPADAAAKKHHKMHHAAAPAGATAEELHALTEQVQALTSKLQEQEQATQAAQAQAQQAQSTAAEAQASAHAAQEQARAEVDTIPGVVKKDIEADRPYDGKVHLRNNVTLTFGGFAAAEGVYRSKSELADIGSNYAKIPFANNVLNHVSETRGTARQSRISLLAQGDINPTTHASFYTELDFLAGPQTANSNASNSFSPRIRNVYGALDWDDMMWGGGLHLLAGQSWSLVTLNGKGITPRNEVSPPTIDAQYVTGFSWARQPQVRLTADFMDKQIWAAVSVENPATVLASAATGTGTTVTGVTATTGGTSTSQFDNTNTITFNHIPDIVGKLAFEPNLFGSRPLHLEVYGIYRSFYDRVSAATGNALHLPVGINNSDTDSGGFGAGMTWAVVPKLLDVEASALTGRGIGRYGAGGLPDAVVGPDGRVKPITETMYLAGATLHATPTLDLYLFGGEEHDNRLSYTVAGKGFGYGSGLATLAACSTEGGTCSPDIQLETQLSGGLWDKVYQGSYGSVRVGLQYSYTELTAFSGAAGVRPKTNDSMVFTSFRYYPF